MRSDVIVVGAGVAGCAAAATALELGRAVKVIEAGPGGPLPSALRSLDLNRAVDDSDRWWPGDYPAGRGIGGGSAVNGMVVQAPLEMDAEFQWAWDCIDPVRADPGPLGQALAAVAGSIPGVGVETAWLSALAGHRRTAADVWLQPNDKLSVVTDQLVTADDVRRWNNSGRVVLVAAGALRSPGLVGTPPLAARDHPSRSVGFGIPAKLRLTSTERPVANVLIRSGPIQILVLERAGSRPDRGALVVAAMDGDEQSLTEGIDLATNLLDGVGLAGLVEPGAQPVSHACCTLAGVETMVPVVDASTLPDLPAVNPMLTIAGHARRVTLDLLTQ